MKWLKDALDVYNNIYGIYEFTYHEYRCCISAFGMLLTFPYNINNNNIERNMFEWNIMDYV